MNIKKIFKISTELGEVKEALDCARKVLDRLEDEEMDLEDLLEKLIGRSRSEKDIKKLIRRAKKESRWTQEAFKDVLTDVLNINRASEICEEMDFFVDL